MLKKEKGLFCRMESRQGRESYHLGNGVIELVTLTGGGHIAEMRLVGPRGHRSPNPLWAPPWESIEPYRYRAAVHARRYGPSLEGKLLSGIAGQNICLDYFGPPSPEECEQGLTQHGEAPSRRWRKAGQLVTARRVALTLSTDLPEAGLDFKREITLRPNTPVVEFKETVVNQKKSDHLFHWVQHVTLGPPFLSAQDCSVFVSGTRGFTFPVDYNEGKSLLALAKDFRWPMAPKRGGGKADLRRVLLRRGFGLVASVLVDPKENRGYVAALNTRQRLLIGYCFDRKDFPWVTIWEENRAIKAPPWKRRTETRGLEFGTTPNPVLRRDAFQQGTIFGAPTFTFVPARGQKTIRYLAFLASLPKGFTVLQRIAWTKDGLLLRDSHGRTLCIAA